MISLYDIIEGVNPLLKEGMLVLHRTMKLHPTFKVYKIFSYNLYRVCNNKKTLVHSYEETRNTPTEELN